MVMIAIALGALVIPPFLNNAGTSLMGARSYRQTMEEQYAADSGAEHAIWGLKYGGYSSGFNKVGDMLDYSLGESVNGLQVDVEITKTGEPSTYSIASEAGSRTLSVSASVNSTALEIFNWHFE